MEAHREAEPNINKSRTLTFLNGIAVVLGMQIGSGVFAAPAVVIALVQSTPIAIFVWLCAGLLVWTGASCFIELGIAIPANGGMQEYLREAFGDDFGFLFAFAWIVLVKPCSVAMISLVFSEYLLRLFQIDAEDSPWAVKIISFVALSSITYLNCIGTRTGTRAATAFLAVKVFGLLSIAALGVIYRSRAQDGSAVIASQRNSELASITEDAPSPQFPLWEVIGQYVDASFAALFTYGGWESLGFIAGEIQNPGRTLPRILNTSMTVVILLVCLANVALYNIVPLETMKQTNAVAVAFGKAILGSPGAIMYTWVVCLSCLGALNAVMFAAGRLTEVSGKRHYMPAILGRNLRDMGDGSRIAESHERRCLRDWAVHLRLSSDDSVPVNAMIFNALVSVIFVLTGSFRGLSVFKGLIEYTVYLTTVAGLLRVRRQSRLTAETTGRYRTPTFNPIIFTTVSMMIVARGAMSHPFQFLGIVAFFACGLVLRRCGLRSRLAETQEILFGS